MAVFGAMSDARLARIIARAEERVLLCMPAVRKATTAALVETGLRLGTHAVRVVLDCDDEVIRLGYGDVQCIRELQEEGVDVRQCGGLRVGLLVVDGRAWTFTPTALYVQPEAQSGETPNAVELPARNDRQVSGGGLG